MTPNFALHCTVIKTTKLSLWVFPKFVPQIKMADGRHLENLKIAISQKSFGRFWQNFAWCHILVLQRLPTVQKFKLLIIQDHSVALPCYTVVRSTWSYGDSKISGGRNPITSELIDKKFGVSDYVDSLHAKSQNKRHMRDPRVVFSFSILFCHPNFARVPRLNHRTNFYAVCFIWRQFQVICISRGITM